MESFYDGVMWAAGVILAISVVAVGVALAAIAVHALRARRVKPVVSPPTPPRLARVEIAGFSPETMGQFGGCPIPASIRVCLTTADGGIRYVTLPFVGLSTHATRRGGRPVAGGIARLGVTALGGLLFAQDIPADWLMNPQPGVNHASR